MKVIFLLLLILSHNRLDAIQLEGQKKMAASEADLAAMYTQMQQLQQQQQTQVQQAQAAAATAQAALQQQQQAQQAAQAQASSVPTVAQLQSVIDTKVLTRMTVWDGKDPGWQEWSFIFESSDALIGIEDDMMIVVNNSSDNAVQPGAMNDRAKVVAKALCHLLISLVRGKAFTIVKNCEKHNGLLAWRRLMQEYQPAVAGRFNSMLMQIPTPTDWQEVSRDKPFDEVLAAWEDKVQQYISQSRKNVDSATMIAVVTRWAPAGIKQAIRQAVGGFGDDYSLLRKFVLDYLRSGRDYDAQLDDGPLAVPMDVGAIEQRRGGPGAGKGTGKKFEGTSNFCKKKGHKAS